MLGVLPCSRHERHHSQVANDDLRAQRDPSKRSGERRVRRHRRPSSARSASARLIPRCRGASIAGAAVELVRFRSRMSALTRASPENPDARRSRTGCPQHGRHSASPAPRRPRWRVRCPARRQSYPAGRCSPPVFAVGSEGPQEKPSLHAIAILRHVHTRRKTRFAGKLLQKSPRARSPEWLQFRMT